MSDNSIPPFLPLSYATIPRACRLLDCEEEDLLQWIESGAIQLNVKLGEGERAIIKKGSPSTLSFFMRKRDLPPIDTKKNPVLHDAERASIESLRFGSQLSTYYSVMTVGMTVMQDMPSLQGCPTFIPPYPGEKQSTVSYLCDEPGIAFFSQVYPVGIWHLQKFIGYDTLNILHSISDNPVEVTCLLTPERLLDTDFFGDDHDVLPSILKCDLQLSKENLVIMGDDLLRIHKAKYSFEPLIRKQELQNVGGYFESASKNSKSKDRFIESLLDSWENGNSPSFIKEQPVSQNAKIQLLVHMHPRLGAEAVKHPHTGAKKIVELFSRKNIANPVTERSIANYLSSD